jgi:hypothetical protein
VRSVQKKKWSSQVAASSVATNLIENCPVTKSASAALVPATSEPATLAITLKSIEIASETWSLNTASIISRSALLNHPLKLAFELEKST